MIILLTKQFRVLLLKWYEIVLQCDSEMLNVIAQWNTYAVQYVKFILLLAFRKSIVERC